MFGKLLAALGIDGITIRILIESILVRRALCKNICLNIFNSLGHNGFLSNVSITVIDKTNRRNPKKR